MQVSSYNKGRESILRSALELFIKEGFQKTTMDSIAYNTGTSKNTIYKYFPSKEKLIEEIIEFNIQNVVSHISGIISSENNAVIKFVEIIEFISAHVLKMYETMSIDLKIYMPHLWEKVENIRFKYMNRNLSKIIGQGKKEKLFLDFPSEIVLLALVGALRASVSNVFVLNNKYSMSESIKITSSILLNGLLTEKGKNILVKIKK
jgi:AcrR family transcriptional regulator